MCLVDVALLSVAPARLAVLARRAEASPEWDLVRAAASVKSRACPPLRFERGCSTRLLLPFSQLACCCPSSPVQELIYKRGFGKVNKQRIPITDNSVIEQVRTGGAQQSVWGFVGSATLCSR